MRLNYAAWPQTDLSRHQNLGPRRSNEGQRRDPGSCDRLIIGEPPLLFAISGELPPICVLPPRTRRSAGGSSIRGPRQDLTYPGHVVVGVRVCWSVAIFTSLVCWRRFTLRLESSADSCHLEERDGVDSDTKCFLNGLKPVCLDGLFSDKPEKKMRKNSKVQFSRGLKSKMTV